MPTVIIRTMAELMNRTVIVQYPGGAIPYRIVAFSADTLTFISPAKTKSSLPWAEFQNLVRDGFIVLEDAVTFNRREAA